MRVEKYITNVKNEQQALFVLKALQLRISDCQLSFDMDSFYLLVGSSREISELVCGALVQHGFLCEKIKSSL